MENAVDLFEFDHHPQVKRPQMELPGPLGLSVHADGKQQSSPRHKCHPNGKHPQQLERMLQQFKPLPQVRPPPICHQLPAIVFFFGEVGDQWMRPCLSRAAVR